jgi:hypothetical protein
VRRLESSGWRDLTSGGIALGGYAAGLDLSIDESGEPQVAWAEVEASSSWKLVIRGAFLEGTSWRFFAGLGWEDGTDPVAWKVSRFGELFVGRVEASRQRYYVTMYRRDGTGQDLGSIPGTFGGALLLGSDGRPRIIWRENSAYCGRRWTGESWAWMATDTACASDGGPPGAASVGLADIPTVCDYDHVRGGGPNILCHRYNEYVRATLSVPLEKIVINEAKGGTTSGGGPHQFRVAYRPADATDRILTWKVCTGPAVACSPDPTGHCRTCTTATNLGTITNSGLYTPPSSLALPAKVWVLACQKAICDWSFVDVAP